MLILDHSWSKMTTDDFTVWTSKQQRLKPQADILNTFHTDYHLLGHVTVHVIENVPELITECSRDSRDWQSKAGISRPQIDRWSVRGPSYWSVWVQLRTLVTGTLKMTFCPSYYFTLFMFNCTIVCVILWALTMAEKFKSGVLMRTTILDCIKK